MRALLIWSFVWWSAYFFVRYAISWRIFHDNPSNRLAFGMAAGIMGGIIGDIFLLNFLLDHIVISALFIASFVASLLILFSRFILKEFKSEVF